MTIDETAFFRDVTVAMCRHLHAEDALHACAARLAEYMPMTRMYLEVYEPGPGAVRTIATATPQKGEALDLVVPMTPDQREIITGFRDQSPEDNVFRVGRARDDALSRKMLEALGLSPGYSILGTYPALDGQVQGAVVVIAEGDDRFTATHARLLGLLKNPFAIALRNAVRYREIQFLQARLAEDNRALRRELGHTGTPELVGADAGLQAVLTAAEQVAVHDSPVLLQGETGTGKDLVARYIHARSPRADRPMVAVNCGALPDGLVDSELFGHEKGAFTGAVHAKPGRFERAQGGTIFLDEIGELSPEAQVRLLRVLQTGEFERVGGVQTRRADVRVVSATHRDLEAMVAAGTFRQDLWYRLSVFPIRVPPLRERRGDIPGLVEHLVARKGRRLNLGPPPAVTPAQLAQLEAYAWPGNVRELENVVERALILGGGARLALDLVGLGPAPAVAASSTSAAPEALGGTLDEAIARHIRRALERANGKISGPDGAAAQLGLAESTLRSKMKRLGLVAAPGSRPAATDA